LKLKALIFVLTTHLDSMLTHRRLDPFPIYFSLQVFRPTQSTQQLITRLSAYLTASMHLPTLDFTQPILQQLATKPS